MVPSAVPAPISSAENASRGRFRGLLWQLPALALACFLVAVVVLYFAIARQATKDETRPADVIVVFGAAEYSGRPSPVYRARLDHAAALYRRNLAPFIITTGGAGGDPEFSEGQVGRNYLRGLGVPSNRVIAETQGEDTLASAARLAAIMRENNMRNCLAVSDGYHMFRIKRMMQAQGLAAFAAPRPDSHPERLQMLEEAIKFLAWKMHLL